MSIFASKVGRMRGKDGDQPSDYPSQGLLLINCHKIKLKFPVCQHLFLVLSVSNVKAMCCSHSRQRHSYFIPSKNIDCGADMDAPFLFSQKNYSSFNFFLPLGNISLSEGNKIQQR